MCVCICHDEWIPHAVRLKPKLSGHVVDSHVSPTHCPKGSQDQDHCSGSVCSHTWNMGLDYTGAQIWLIPRRGGGGRPPLLFCTNVHTLKTHTSRNDGYITDSQRGPCGSTHLPKTDVKNKSERSPEWKEAPHRCNSTNSRHSALTGEQTAAHDNTHQRWKQQKHGCTWRAYRHYIVQGEGVLSTFRLTGYALLFLAHFCCYVSSGAEGFFKCNCSGRNRNPPTTDKQVTTRLKAVWAVWRGSSFFRCWLGEFHDFFI